MAHKNQPIRFSNTLAGSQQEEWLPLVSPPTLFRYLTTERAKEVLRDNRLYLCSPNSFNDPFDCRLRPGFAGSKAEYKRIGLLLAKGTKPNASRQALRGMVAKVRDKLNPMAFEKLYDSWESQLLNKSGMLCLTEWSNDLLMWSHYADKHTGVCLQFEHILGRDLLGNAMPVRYVDSYPGFSFVRTFAQIHNLEQQSEALVEFGKVLFLTKSTHWAYEKEWRLIDFPIDGQPRYGSRNFAPHALIGVILGCKMNDDCRGEILALVKQREPVPSIYQAAKKDREFALQIRRFE